MRICSSLEEYLALPPEEKLRTYLVEDQAALVEAVENGSPAVDVRLLPDGQLLSFHESLPNSFLRREAAEALLRAAAALDARGYSLELLEAYRPYAKQKKEFDEIHAEIAARHPDLSGKDLWRKVTEFIADPDLCPPHCSAAAVDVRLLVNETGETADMGCEFNTTSEISYLLRDDISPEAQANRRILMDAMLDAGFAPMPTEWWHYSYGDRYWGAYLGKPAIYTTLKTDPTAA